jgi:hypothetical protein
MLENKYSNDNIIKQIKTYQDKIALRVIDVQIHLHTISYKWEFRIDPQIIPQIGM